MNRMSKKKVQKFLKLERGAEKEGHGKDG